MPATLFFDSDQSKVTVAEVFDCESCDSQLPAGLLCKIFGEEVLELSRHVGRPVRNNAWVCLDCAELAGVNFGQAPRRGKATT